MTGQFDLALDLKPATDGTIAANNLESARLRSWNRFWSAPEHPGIAEIVLEQELLTAQFRGDLSALDRIETLANELVRIKPHGAQTALVAAQVASAVHRFEDARASLAQAKALGAPSDTIERLSLSIDQATGKDFHRILSVRRERAAQLDRWEELVPLGALLADLGEFDEAEQAYHRALREYRDVSPFALAWVCFELGALWGESVPSPRAELAAQWYRAAIDYLPCYVKARVHLAEILLGQGKTEDADNLLGPVLASGDPEVYWRLAEVAEAANNLADAESFMEAARSGFEILLARHLLAFADHGAEFYLAGGGNHLRAFELARLNLANRPTSRAYELVLEAARAVGESDVVAELVARASSLSAHLNECTGMSEVLCQSQLGEDEIKEPANART